MNIPKLICTSTIRSIQKGNSHGGIYVADFKKNSFVKTVDWDNSEIDWAGRGGDRGLRGIEFYDGKIIVTSSNEIFFFDKDFNIVESYTNPYLRHSHEITKEGSKLYVTSTGFDSILVFDLPSRKFVKGYCIRPSKGKRKSFEYYRKYLKLLQFKSYDLQVFDPRKKGGPVEEDIIHINHVKVHKGKIYTSGTKFNSLIEINPVDNKITKKIKCSFGTHNAQIYKGNLLFNDTKEDRALLRTMNGRLIKKFNIKEFNPQELTNKDIPKDHARIGFCRGMAIHGDYLAVGYSPSTVSIYKLSGDSEPIATMNFSLDIRNSIHGLAFCPNYDE